MKLVFLLVLALAHKAEFEQDQPVLDQATQHLSPQEMDRRRQYEAHQHLLNEEAILNSEQDYSKWFKLYFERYGLEVMIMLVLGISLLNWLIGSYINHRKANQWLAVVTPFLQQQFKTAQIEFNDTTSSTFEIILAGRANVHYCKAILALQNRQSMSELLARVVLSMFYTFQKDTLILEMPIKRELVNSEILITQAKELKEVKKH